MTRETAERIEALEVERDSHLTECLTCSATGESAGERCEVCRGYGDYHSPADWERTYPDKAAELRALYTLTR